MTVVKDPQKTWNTTRRHHQSYQWVGPELQAEIPSARVLLYDHLSSAERAVELKAASHPEHKASREAYAVVQKTISKFGIEEWTNRFLKVLREKRKLEFVSTRMLLLSL